MYQKLIKRFVDLLIVLFLMPIFLLILIPISILIKIEDQGPVFYRGDRLGKDLKKFKMIKFRSMKVDAPDIRNYDGTTYNNEYDDRQTKIGKILRKTSIDEIPQILNVLKGDMSIVGPRPSPTGNEKLYSVSYLNKFKVRPGITGFSQAYFRNEANISTREKNDLYYVENCSLKLDVKILLKTFNTVIKKKGIYNKNRKREIE